MKFKIQNYKVDKYEAILFDLGGVILNLDYELTSKAFQQLGWKDFDNFYTQGGQSSLFDDLETGKISPSFFINSLLPYLPVGTTANKVVHAWNAMILDFPSERLNLLRKLMETKRVYLLSNTNEIHWQAVLRSFSKTTQEPFESFFHKVFLSHEIGLRKPHVEAFEFVCKSENLNPARVLFIDDTIRHVGGARKAGLNAIHLEKGDVITLFD